MICVDTVLPGKIYRLIFSKKNSRLVLYERLCGDFFDKETDFILKNSDEFIVLETINRDKFVFVRVMILGRNNTEVGWTAFYTHKIDFLELISD